MQTDTAAHQLRRQEVAFDGLADEEDRRDDDDRYPAIELRQREPDRQQQADHRSEVGNEGEETGDKADGEPEVEAGKRQANGIEHRQRQADRSLDRKSTSLNSSN